MSNTEEPRTRILIVDDEPNNLRILNYTLNKAGFETVNAANGSLALELLGEVHVDLAIVDVAMPVMDGITLVRNLRGMEKFINLPIIIHTGSGDDFERQRAEKMGIQGFITKPASSKMILETVNTVLGNK